MDREANFSIEECISECMQNRIGEVNLLQYFADLLVNILNRHIEDVYEEI